MDDLTRVALDCFRVVTGASPAPTNERTCAKTEAKLEQAAGRTTSNIRAVPAGWRALLRSACWRPGSFEDAF